MFLHLVFKPGSHWILLLVSSNAILKMNAYYVGLLLLCAMSTQGRDPLPYSGCEQHINEQQITLCMPSKLTYYHAVFRQTRHLWS